MAVIETRVLEHDTEKFKKILENQLELISKDETIPQSTKTELIIKLINSILRL